LGVAVFAGNVRAGGDRVVSPRGSTKGVLYTAVDLADNKQYRRLYTSPAARRGGQEGRAAADGTVITLIQYKAKLGADGNPEKGTPMALSSRAISSATP